MIILLLLSVITIACESDSASDNPATLLGTNALSAIINDKPFSSLSEFTNAVVITNDFANFITITAASVEPDNTFAISESIGLVVSFTDLSEFRVSQTWQSGSMKIGESVVGQYIFVRGNQTSTEANIASSDTEDNKAKFTITALNTDERTLSGTFSFVGIDEENGDEYTVTNGVFNEITYQLNPN